MLAQLPLDRRDSQRKGWHSPPDDDTPRRTSKTDERGQRLNNLFSLIKGEPEPERFKKYVRKGLNENLHHLLDDTGTEIGEPEPGRFKKYVRKGLNENLHHILDDTGTELGKIEKDVSEAKYSAIAEEALAGVTFIWSSKTLPLELSLPLFVTPETLQAVATMMLIASVVKHPGLFFFLVYDPGKNVVQEDLKALAVHAVRLFQRSLSVLLPGDIPYILPGMFSEPEFNKKAILKAISEGWNDNLTDSPTNKKNVVNARRMWDKGPTSLSQQQADDFEKAVRKMATLSRIPALDEGGKYEMDSAQTAAVIQLVRDISDPPVPKMTVWRDVTQDKVKRVALEGAKRVAFLKPVMVLSDDSNINDTVRKMKERIETNLDVYNGNADQLTAVKRTGTDLDAYNGNAGQLTTFISFDSNDIVHFRKEEETSAVPNSQPRRRGRGKVRGEQE